MRLANGYNKQQRRKADRRRSKKLLETEVLKFMIEADQNFYEPPHWDDYYANWDEYLCNAVYEDFDYDYEVDQDPYYEPYYDGYDEGYSMGPFYG